MLRNQSLHVILLSQFTQRGLSKLSEAFTGVLSSLPPHLFFFFKYSTFSEVLELHPRQEIYNRNAEKNKQEQKRTGRSLLLVIGENITYEQNTHFHS